MSMIIKNIKRVNQKYLEDDFPLVKSIFVTASSVKDRTNLEQLKGRTLHYNNKFKIYTRESLNQWLDQNEERDDGVSIGVGWCAVYNDNNNPRVRESILD